MQVIHKYKGSYPFQKQRENGQTYVQVLKQNISQEQIIVYRKKLKIIKEINQPNIMKLLRIYKQQSSFHLLYEYYSLSFEKYLQIKSEKIKDNHKEEVREIYSSFSSSIDKIIDILVILQIKTDIIIQNFAVTSIENCQFKLFIDPDSELLGVNSQNQHHENSPINKASLKNKEFLQQFYAAEKKRLVIQLQELIQKKTGKTFTFSELNKPNFIINGSKLVFLNDNKKLEKQHKNHLIGDLNQEKLTIKTQIRKQMHRGSPIEKVDPRKELKQKNMKRIEQIKNVMHKFDHRAPSMNNNEETKPSLENPDEIVFKEDEMANDKTAILNENQFLSELQHQLKDMSANKKKSSSQQKRLQIIKQINELQEKNKASQMRKTQDNMRIYDREKNTLNIKHLSEHEKLTRSHEYIIKPEHIVKPEQKKQEKVNKYKMKIVTSHEIEFENTNQPYIKQPQKNIFQGARSGKINVDELSHRPKTKYENQSCSTSSNHQIHHQFLHPNMATGFIDRHIGGQQIKNNPRYSDVASKSKKISEFIQKIHSKSNINTHLTNSAHQNEIRVQNNEPNSPVRSHKDEDQNNSQNYYDKIKQSKQKAQQALKEYAKKKH